MTLTKRELAEIAEELGAIFDPDSPFNYRARYNVAPTDVHPILRVEGGQRRLEPARWGMLGTGKSKAPLINARAATAPQKAAFREAYARGRCVVPADGFFEWKDSPQGRQPIWFHRPDGKLLLMAGLCWEGRFTVLTTEPNKLLAEVHDRMPAILTEPEAARWLATPTQEVLHPAAEGMLEARPVSTRVNSVKNDDPECLAPPGEGPRQLTLV